ncbi:hypothetical protein U0070_011814 [Myodes glareolus]|uniref:Uncharacterized protein n=1 Tax=Myodes glareolus TaxID=447135 RepID=A0AAW0K1K3_MYOGA
MTDKQRDTLKGLKGGGRANNPLPYIVPLSAQVILAGNATSWETFTGLSSGGLSAQIQLRGQLSGNEQIESEQESTEIQSVCALKGKARGATSAEITQGVEGGRAAHAGVVNRHHKLQSEARKGKLLAIYHANHSSQSNAESNLSSPQDLRFTDSPLDTVKRATPPKVPSMKREQWPEKYYKGNLTDANRHTLLLNVKEALQKGNKHKPMENKALGCEGVLVTGFETPSKEAKISRSLIAIISSIQYFNRINSHSAN